jgi:probable F420-dependent oxidoreductase
MPEALIEIAQAIEAAGLEACAVSDHPFPVVDEGLPGFHAMDPFVALAHVSAATKALRLLTGVVVLPYRNPFLAANTVATLDHLSGGRVLMGVGMGYQQQEFTALGVDLGQRGRLMEEALSAMKMAWTGKRVTAQGGNWIAAGNSLLPRPVSLPHPPIWMGGNSRAAIGIAVASCQGWIPFQTTPDRNTRTASISSLEELKPRIAHLKTLMVQSERRDSLDICYMPRPEWLIRSEEAIHEDLEAMSEMGITWIISGPRAASSEAPTAVGSKSKPELLERIQAFGELVRRWRGTSGIN